ncbi:MAG: type II secretion system protein N [Woeseiaceae bacterium]|nr:type II secretion system protein N [Woeseiaceae bacterium]
MKRLVIVGVTVFLAVLIVSFPARVAYDWFAPDALQLAGISGSVWSGSAAEAKTGDAYIRNISWRFSPMALLTGKLAFRTTSNPASGTMRVVVAISPSGTLTLTDLDGNLPLDLLHPALQQGGVRGDLALQFDSVVMRNGIPVAAEGIVTVNDFFVADLSASQLGDYRAEFQTNDDTIVGSVEDVSGVLDVAGTITLSPDRSYSFIGLVAPTPMTPPAVVNQLRYLGTANARGQHEFRFEGQL